MFDCAKLGPIRRAAISAASTDNTLVAAAGANKVIRVLSYVIDAAGALTARFEDGTGGTALSGQMALAANGGIVAPHNPYGWFETSANTLLNLELSTSSVSGHLTYQIITTQS